MQRALGEMTRRRKKQLAHNAAHGVTPKSIQKAIIDLDEFQCEAKRESLKLMQQASSTKPLTRKNAPHLLASLEGQMRDAAESLDFELAAMFRDQISDLRELTGLKPRPTASGRRKKRPNKRLKKAAQRIARRRRAR